MARYAVWDKTSNVYTPSGECFTAAQWKERYPFCNIPAAVPVVAGGMFNGGFIGELSEMEDLYTKAGADFSGATTNEEKLAVIEAFEDAQNAGTGEPTAEERIAAQLEYQSMMLD